MAQQPASVTQATDADGAVVDGLLAAGRLLLAQTARTLAQLDANVTLPQFRTLVVLGVSGPKRVVDLATGLGVKPSTATRMCNRLAGKHLVSRHERPEDRRAVWIALTPAGRSLVAEVMRLRRKEISEVMSAAAVPDPHAFAAGLTAFVVAGGELPEPQWWQQWATAAAEADSFQQPHR